MPQDRFETENELLVALKAGDHRAFEQLYNQYKRQICCMTLEVKARFDR